MTKYEIKSRFDGQILFSLECWSLKLCVEAAVKSGANLSYANLTGANLTYANLTGANLTYANLTGANLTYAKLTGANLFGANLSYAKLTGANLFGANLTGANLFGANLTGAHLSGANLSYAKLTGANLFGANLTGANLFGANLTGAHLSGANLTGAHLSGANLSYAKNAELAIAKTRILAEGDLIGWKKCCNGALVKLRIPAAAKRSHAFGRKCRAEFVDVLEVIGAEFGETKTHGPKTIYRTGERVTADSWDEDFQNECSSGIHFFITRDEAEDW